MSLVESFASNVQCQGFYQVKWKDGQMDNDQPKGDNDQPNGQTNSTDYTYPYSSHKENNVRDLGL